MSILIWNNNYSDIPFEKFDSHNTKKKKDKAESHGGIAECFAFVSV